MNDSTLSRLREFRQLKKEIRGSGKHLIVGIDVAKEKHHAFFGTAAGKSLLRRLIFDNNIEGFETLLQRARAIMTQEGLTEVVFGVEPTADYHKPLGEFLINNGLALVLVSNGAAKKNRETLDGRWDKNDTKDSANVADLISQVKFLYYDLPSLPIRDLRNLLSFKRKLKAYEHSIRMRIRNHLVTQFFPELDKYYGHREGENLAIVKWCLNPRQIAAMDFQEFFNMVTTRDMGSVQRQRLRSIQEAARHSVGCEFGESVAFEAKMLVSNLTRIRESIAETDAKIAQFCRQLPGYENILSIPGIGPAVASVVLAAIGDPHRFSKVTQVIKLAGLDLSASRSGKKAANVTPKLSKKGKAALRYAMYQAAIVATTRNKYFIEYSTGLIKGREREQGIKTKMRVKVTTKMLVIAWTLLKKGEKFQPEYLLKQRKL
jgi:transposase